jgi:hypothetical protein
MIPLTYRKASGPKSAHERLLVRISLTQRAGRRTKSLKDVHRGRSMTTGFQSLLDKGRGSHNLSQILKRCHGRGPARALRKAVMVGQREELRRAKDRVEIAARADPTGDCGGLKPAIARLQLGRRLGIPRHHDPPNALILVAGATRERGTFRVLDQVALHSARRPGLLPAKPGRGVLPASDTLNSHNSKNVDIADKQPVLSRPPPCLLPEWQQLIPERSAPDRARPPVGQQTPPAHLALPCNSVRLSPSTIHADGTWMVLGWRLM